MSGESDQNVLRAVIIKNSQSTTWDLAKTEWALQTIFDEQSHCICGQSIMENCVIYNPNTCKTLIVGNVCINKFEEEAINVDDRCRESLKRLTGDPLDCSMNRYLVDLAFKLNILSKREKDWYLDQTKGRQSRNRFNHEHVHFDQGAYDKRKKYNQLVLYGFKKDRPRCHCDSLCKPRQNSNNGSYFYGCCNYPEGCKFTKSIIII